MTERMLREDKEGLCALTLNRPDKLNVLDTRSCEVLDAQLADLEAPRVGLQKLVDDLVQESVVQGEYMPRLLSGSRLTDSPGCRQLQQEGKA